MNTGKAIKKALIDAGKSQTWLANEFDISRQAMNIICNRKSCSSSTLERVAEKLNISCSSLVSLGE